jgi:hypothetical protein
MLALIPHSVKMNARGYVRDPKAKYMQNPWVKKGCTVAEIAKKAMNARADRLLNALERFKAIWVAQSRIARREYAVRMASEAWTREVWSESWASIMELDAMARANIRKEFEARLISMSEHDLAQYNAHTIREIREHNDDVWSWVEFMRSIRAKRVARAKLEENLNVWREMALATIGVPVTLHNTQVSAKKRVVRRTGGFSALDDSDSE